jgi:hypothetical protein
VIETRYQEVLATATWRKASYSQGQNDCVEVAVATNWRKASYSQGQNGCVEVGSVPDVIGVRDSKLGPAGPILAFGQAGWAAFTDQLTVNE